MLYKKIASYVMSFDQIPSIGFLTNQAARRLARALDVRLSRVGMRAAHMPVLVALMRNEKLTQKELAEIAGIEQPTMAATLTRMEASGLIDRHPSPGDGRSMLITLSSEAEGKIDEVQKIVEEVTTLAEADFTEGEDAQYRALITKMIASLDEDPLR